jgi:hypothetical protein
MMSLTLLVQSVPSSPSPRPRPQVVGIYDSEHSECDHEVYERIRSRYLLQRLSPVGNSVRSFMQEGVETCPHGGVYRLLQKRNFQPPSWKSGPDVGIPTFGMLGLTVRVRVVSYF